MIRYNDDKNITYRGIHFKHLLDHKLTDLDHWKKNLSIFKTSKPTETSRILIKVARIVYSQAQRKE